MISILLTFSLRVAGGVFRRRKSTTRVALKADIGRLRSAWLVYDTDWHINQRYTYKTTTSWRSTTQELAKGHITRKGHTISRSEPMNLQ
jgi:hypothetical protein